MSETTRNWPKEARVWKFLDFYEAKLRNEGKENFNIGLIYHLSQTHWRY